MCSKNGKTNKKERIKWSFQRWRQRCSYHIDQVRKNDYLLLFNDERKWNQWRARLTVNRKQIIYSWPYKWSLSVCTMYITNECVCACAIFIFTKFQQKNCRFVDFAKRAMYFKSEKDLIARIPSKYFLLNFASSYRFCNWIGRKEAWSNSWFKHFCTGN